MTLAIEIGIERLRAGRSIHVTDRTVRLIRRGLGDDGSRLESEPSSVGWVVLRLPVAK